MIDEHLERVFPEWLFEDLIQILTDLMDTDREAKKLMQSASRLIMKRQSIVRGPTGNEVGLLKGGAAMAALVQEAKTKQALTADGKPVEFEQGVADGVFARVEPPTAADEAGSSSSTQKSGKIRLAPLRKAARKVINVGRLSRPSAAVPLSPAAKIMPSDPPPSDPPPSPAAAPVAAEKKYLARPPGIMAPSKRYKSNRTLMREANDILNPR